MSDDRFPNWQAKAFKAGRFDTVAKVGGSVVYGDHLEEAASALQEAGKHTRLLVVPGGGLPDVLFERAFDDGRISAPGLTATTELALDQTGLVLADQLDPLVAVNTVREAAAVASRTVSTATSGSS